MSIENKNNADTKNDSSKISKNVTGADTISHDKDGQHAHIHIPILFRRRGGRSRITTPDGQPLTPPAQHSAPALRDALVRAHRWMQQLETGEVTTLAEIAAKEGITSKSKVPQQIRLISLSPAIQEAILTGAGLGFLTLDDFMKPFPERWEEQERVFGVSIDTNTPI